jgi:hypothetical protein
MALGGDQKQRFSGTQAVVLPSPLHTVHRCLHHLQV